MRGTKFIIIIKTNLSRVITDAEGVFLIMVQDVLLLVPEPYVTLTVPLCHKREDWGEGSHTREVVMWSLHKLTEV